MMNSFYFDQIDDDDRRPVAFHEVLKVHRCCVEERIYDRDWWIDLAAGLRSLRRLLLSIGGRGDMFVMSCVQCNGIEPRSCT